MRKTSQPRRSRASRILNPALCEALEPRRLLTSVADMDEVDADNRVVAAQADDFHEDFIRSNDSQSAGPIDVLQRSAVVGGTGSTGRQPSGGLTRKIIYT